LIFAFGYLVLMYDLLTLGRRAPASVPREASA
jgi:hypothetical protein